MSIENDEGSEKEDSTETDHEDANEGDEAADLYDDNDGPVGELIRREFYH